MPRRDAGRRLALTIGLLLPAGLCFSTVGRLWWLPGPLLLCAAGMALAVEPGRAYVSLIRTHWLAGLLGVLGATELLMAVSAPPLTAVIGIVGGLALLAAPWPATYSRTISWVLVAIGTLPFAALTYWAVVPAVLAVLALLIALPLLLRQAPQHSHPTRSRLLAAPAARAVGAGAAGHRPG
ncbi:MAG: hypothetical protein JWQ99_4029 [Blastococcus sp.]|nr:hypothetical protein [Blastococcus sp.]